MIAEIKKINVELKTSKIVSVKILLMIILLGMPKFLLNICLPK